MKKSILKVLLKNKKGQSTIEFILSMIFLLSFTFFFTQLAMVFGFANFTQYAVFMSSRALLSSGINEEDQVQRARDVLAASVKKGIGNPTSDRWDILGKGQGDGDVIPGANIGNIDNFQFADKSLSWQQGVRYTFRSRLFALPLGQRATNNEVTLISESFLTRETSTSECQAFMNQLVGGNAVIDNGC